MIYKNGIDMTARYYGAKVITAVYHGARLVWQAVSSCFGSGYWQQGLPWTNNDGWVE